MAPPRRSLTYPMFGSLLLIAVVIGACVTAFACTAGWFSPQRLTPDKLVDAFMPPGGEPLGHRRNHAKGICFTGIFDANGAGSALSQAQFFTRGQYPVLGRFNLGTADPNAPDATVRVRGMGLRIATPNGQEWRSAMIDTPILSGIDATSVLRLVDSLGEQGPEGDADIRCRAS
jgi:catalase